MKICVNCGTACQESARFCSSCGTAFADMHVDEKQGEAGSRTQSQGNQDAYNSWQGNNGQQNAYGSWQGNNGRQGAYGSWQGDPYGSGPVPPYNTYGIRRRSIPLAVIFTIITFGIYGIYWMIRINDDVNQLAGEPEATSGGLVFLFSLITFGIYSYYWLYKMGERCDVIQGKWNGSKSILYLVLGLVGLSIVSYALIQDVINKSLEMQNG